MAPTLTPHKWCWTPFAKTYPDIEDQIITPLDVQFFLSLCLRPGKKPVPFVPVLDEHLSFYFKKDSLWQSENLWAVVGNDADRTQILHGPVAAQHSTKYDEPVQDILDGIKNGLVSSLLKDAYSGETSNVPLEKSLLEIPPAAPWSDSEGIVSITESPELVVYEISSAGDDLPSPSSWFSLIAGDQYTWRYALLQFRDCHFRHKTVTKILFAKSARLTVTFVLLWKIRRAIENDNHHPGCI